MAVGAGFDAAGDDEHGRTLVSTGGAAYDHRVSVELNHTIVWCRDQHRSATFLAEILGRPAPVRFGPFLVVEVDNGVSLDYHEIDGDIASQHYAFLIGETTSTRSSAASSSATLDYWADPIVHRGPARSTTTTAVGACTSRIPTATSSRSSPVRTGAEADTMTDVEVFVDPELPVGMDHDALAQGGRAAARSAAHLALVLPRDPRRLRRRRRRCPRTDARPRSPGMRCRTGCCGSSRPPGPRSARRSSTRC